MNSESASGYQRPPQRHPGRNSSGRSAAASSAGTSSRGAARSSAPPGGSDIASGAGGGSVPRLREPGKRFGSRGLLLGAAGLVALAVGGTFAVQSLLSDDDSRGGDSDNAGATEINRVTSESTDSTARILKLIHITAGFSYTCGITTDGEPICWGRDDYGQASPPQGLNLTHITTGLSHTCGITTGGEPICWGDNNYGQASPPQGLKPTHG